MTSFPSRRRLLVTGAGAALGLGTAAATASPAAASTEARRTGGVEETRTLDELYLTALAEGGKLVIYAGGDVSTQADGLRAGFKSRFPGIDLTVVVDYSKYHDVRVDNQVATDTLVPDVVQLQTVQDFVRWNEQGHLLTYKPAGFSKVYAPFKDPHGEAGEFADSWRGQPLNPRVVARLKTGTRAGSSMPAGMRLLSDLWGSLACGGGGCSRCARRPRRDGVLAGGVV